MEKSRIIMLFLDLEGTIIEEEQEQLKEQDFNNLLASLNELQKLRNASISMHIVSPVHTKFMEEILDRLDTLIVRYNIQNNTNKLRVSYHIGIACINHQTTYPANY